MLAVPGTQHTVRWQKVKLLVKAVEQILLRKKSSVITMQNYLIWEVHILNCMQLTLPPSKGWLHKFLHLEVLTYSFRILRYFKVYATFATKKIGICHLLPHARIQDTAFYPQKGSKKYVCLPKKLSGSGEVIWSYIDALWQPISVLLVVL